MDQIARDVAFVADRLLPERDVQVTQPRDGAAQQDPLPAFRPERAVRPACGWRAARTHPLLRIPQGWTGVVEMMGWCAGEVRLAVLSCGPTPVRCPELRHATSQPVPVAGQPKRRGRDQRVDPRWPRWAEAIGARGQVGGFTGKAERGGSLESTERRSRTHPGRAATAGSNRSQAVPSRRAVVVYPDPGGGSQVAPVRCW